jgi:hypothetical protein
MTALSKQEIPSDVNEYLGGLSKEEFRTLCNALVDSFELKPQQQYAFDFYWEMLGEPKDAI